MRSPFRRVDIVGKSKNIFGKAVIVLDGHLNSNIVFVSFEIHYFFMQDFFIGIKIFCKRLNASLEMKNGLMLLYITS